jgi:hypothetical protein
LQRRRLRLGANLLSPETHQLINSRHSLKTPYQSLKTGFPELRRAGKYSDTPKSFRTYKTGGTFFQCIKKEKKGQEGRCNFLFFYPAGWRHLT